MRLLISAVSGFAQIIMLLLAARAVCSWFVRSGGGTVYKVYQMLTMLTEPVVAPCRKITSKFNTGMFDISILLAFFLVMIARDILIRVLWMLV